MCTPPPADANSPMLTVAAPPSHRRLQQMLGAVVGASSSAPASASAPSAVLGRSLGTTLPIADGADGVYILANGKRYLDFGAGIAVTNIGQNVPSVVAAVKAQLDKATFIYNGSFNNQPAEDCAKLLLEMCLPDGELAQGRVMFCNSGSEANEIALKLARQFHIERGQPSRFKVLSRYRSYHGNTLAAAALSDRPSWTDQFEVYLNRTAFPAEKLPNPNAARGTGLDPHALEVLIEREGPETVAAFIMEPVSGTSLAGETPSPSYVRAIREICERHGVLLIADEVIMGVGRTGASFAMQHFGVEPDLLTTAKGLCAGYGVLAAVMVGRKVTSVIASGTGSHTQGHTHTANPLSCATAAAVLRYIKDNDVVAHAASRGQYLGKRLRSVLHDKANVGVVRGKYGMFYGVELVADKTTLTPYPKAAGFAAKVVQQAFDRGLLVVLGSPGCANGVDGDQLQLSPALVLTKAQIDWAVGVLAESIDSARLEVEKQFATSALQEIDES